MINKKILYGLTAITLLNANTPESEIGINIGMNATKHENGTEFENPTFGLTYQDNRYVILNSKIYVKLKHMFFLLILHIMLL